MSITLRTGEISPIISALRIAAGVYRKDADATKDTPTVHRAFVNLMTEAARIADRLEDES